MLKIISEMPLAAQTTTVIRISQPIIWVVHQLLNFLLYFTLDLKNFKKK